jgi:NIPSNAP
MKEKLFLSLSFFALMLIFSFKSETTHYQADTRFYEMRIYYAEQGKLEDLVARFRNHTTKLFKKHGMTNEGYWLPIDNKDNKLVYVLSYPNQEAREKSWKVFIEDPKWKKVAAESEKNGKLIAKIESIFMKTTDFSPAKIKKKGEKGRVFELRTYKATPNNLENLLARFRNHTCKLFKQHGMTNLWYWTPTAANNDMLIYFLSHPSKEAGLAAFDKFRQNADWIAVRKASEEKAGGSLTVSVVSEYMIPTDFSPIK